MRKILGEKVVVFPFNLSHSGLLARNLQSRATELAHSNGFSSNSVDKVKSFNKVTLQRRSITWTNFRHVSDRLDKPLFTPGHSSLTRPFSPAFDGYGSGSTTHCFLVSSPPKADWQHFCRCGFFCSFCSQCRRLHSSLIKSSSAEKILHKMTVAKGGGVIKGVIGPAT